MGIGLFESSAEQGEPVELYHLFRGTEDWYYTNAEVAIAYGGNSYVPLEIHRTPVSQGSDDRPGSIDVTMPVDSPFALQWVNRTLASPVSLTIYYLHRALASPTIAFLGEVVDTEAKDSDLVLKATPLAGLLEFQIPRGTMRKHQCIWSTYDPVTCKVDVALFTFTGTVAALFPSDQQVTVTGAGAFVPGLPGATTRPDMFAKGVLVKGERRGLIRSQVGDVIVLQRPVATLAVGDEVSLIAGDDLTKETCLGKFQNIHRYLAHPHMPLNNPYYGRGLET